MPGDTFLSISHFTDSLMNTLDLSPCRRRTKPPPDVLLSPAPRQNQPSQVPGAVLCPSSWHTPLPRSRRCCGEPWAAPEFPFIPSLLPHLPPGLCHPGAGNRDAANATSLCWDVPAEDPGDGAGCYYRGVTGTSARQLRLPWLQVEIWAMGYLGPVAHGAEHPVAFGDT